MESLKSESWKKDSSVPVPVSGFKSQFQSNDAPSRIPQTEGRAEGS